MTLDGPLHPELYVPHIYKHEKPGGRWAAARRRAAAALGGGAPPPNGPRGRRPLGAGPAGRSAAARLAAFRSLPAVASLTGCKPVKLTIFRSQRLAPSYFLRAVTSEARNRVKIRTFGIGSKTLKFTELSASPDRRENLQVP